MTDTTIPHVDVPILGEKSASLAIRWVFPDAGGRITHLSAGTIVFGRESEVDVSLAGPSVSRRHAEIRRQAGGVPMLRDLGSRNGVFLNGRRISQAPIRLHDVIRVGDWVGVLTSIAESGAPRDVAAADWNLEEVTAGYWAGPVLRARLAAARRIAETDLSIVVQGATGVGKEGAARAIHAWSKRAGRFLALNCAALPEALAEGELFGYRKGAFSGADRSSPGFLRAAEGGTLLLDEIADLSLPVQAKLLRAIQEREVVPLGETTPVPIDVRIVAATHVSLRSAVSTKHFRDDLFARLKGFILELPTLRERVEEVPLLFRKLLDRRSSGDRVPGLDAGAVEALCIHPWPHNMRDMTSLVVRLLAIYPDVQLIDRAMVEDLLDVDLDGGNDAVDAKPATADPPTDADQAAVDPAAVLMALRRNRGNVRRAATDLGIGRGRLYRLMEKIDSLDLEQIRKETGTG